MNPCLLTWKQNYPCVLNIKKKNPVNLEWTSQQCHTQDVFLAIYCTCKYGNGTKHPGLMVVLMIIIILLMTVVTKMIARTFIILMALTNWLHRKHNDEHGDQGKHVENSFKILESAINCSYPTLTHLLLTINIMNKPPSPYKLLL